LAAEGISPRLRYIPMRPILTKWPDELADRIDAVVQETGAKRAEFIRHAVEKELDSLAGEVALMGNRAKVKAATAAIHKRAGTEPLSDEELAEKRRYVESRSARDHWGASELELIDRDAVWLATIDALTAERDRYREALELIPELIWIWIPSIIPIVDAALNPPKEPT
jgi:predicted DNA-binding protein